MARPTSVSLAGLMLAVAALAPAQAQQASGGCADMKWHVDREQTAFAGDSLPTVEAGVPLPAMMSAAVVKLAHQDGLTFAVPSTHKPRNTPAFAGAFPILPITVPGPYQVTISDDAWIDVVQNGVLLKQTGFTGSRTCNGVRKSVRFTLAAGPATVMITDAAKDALKIDVLPPAP